jgi:hypothetical protein
MSDTLFLLFHLFSQNFIQFFIFTPKTTHLFLNSINTLITILIFLELFAAAMQSGILV